MPRQGDKASKRAPKVALRHLDESDLSDESVSDYQASSNSEDERCSTPESQKDSRCGVCSRTVNSSDKSLQCDTCSEWCHIKVRSAYYHCKDCLRNIVGKKQPTKHDFNPCMLRPPVPSQTKPLPVEFSFCAPRWLPAVLICPTNKCIPEQIIIFSVGE